MKRPARHVGDLQENYEHRGLWRAGKGRDISSSSKDKKIKEGVKAVAE